jgi:hypothetical protein
MPKAGPNSRRIAVVAVSVAALGMGGGAEVLGSAQVQPRITIKVKREVNRDTLSGRIKAKDKACIRNRKVKLVLRKPNRDRRRVGTARTNRRGKWKFVPKAAGYGDDYADEGTRYADPGEYRAKVNQVRVGGVNCAAGKTSPIHVG